MTGIMELRLAVISLWAENVARTAHFYQDVLGLTLVSHHQERPHFDVGGAYLAILKGKSAPAQGSEPERFPVLAFAVPHLQTAISRLQAHGVDMPWGVEQDAESRWVMFYDPGGNLIELAEFVKGSV